MRLVSLVGALVLTALAGSGELVLHAQMKSSPGLCKATMARLQELAREPLTTRRDWEQGLLLSKGAVLGFSERQRSSASLDQAVAAWKSALGESPFSVQDSDHTANVIVRLVDSIPGDSDIQGEVFSDDGLGSDGRISAEILVRTTVDGRQLSSREIGAVISHEMGHLLGLDDSPDGIGLMGGFDPSNLVSRPTQEEVATVQYLRREARADLG